MTVNPKVTAELVALTGGTPDRYQGWNRSLLGAYRKGALAAHEGKSAVYDCPYLDRRTYAGKVTFSRAFIIAWHDGFSDAQSYMESGGPAVMAPCKRATCTSWGHCPHAIIHSGGDDCIGDPQNLEVVCPSCRKLAAEAAAAKGANNE